MKLKIMLLLILLFSINVFGIILEYEDDLYLPEKGFIYSVKLYNNDMYFLDYNGNLIKFNIKTYTSKKLTDIKNKDNIRNRTGLDLFENKIIWLNFQNSTVYLFDIEKEEIIWEYHLNKDEKYPYVQEYFYHNGDVLILYELYSNKKSLNILCLDKQGKAKFIIKKKLKKQPGRLFAVKDKIYYAVQNKIYKIDFEKKNLSLYRVFSKDSLIISTLGNKVLIKEGEYLTNYNQQDSKINWKRKYDFIYYLNEITINDKDIIIFSIYMNYLLFPKMLSINNRSSLNIISKKTGKIIRKNKNLYFSSPCASIFSNKDLIIICDMNNTYIFNRNNLNEYYQIPIKCRCIIFKENRIYFFTESKIIIYKYKK